MSKSVMLRTSNEDIKLNIDNYPEAMANYYLTNLPDGWCYVSNSNHVIRDQFDNECGCGACFTNTRGTSFQIYICDDRSKTYIRRCASGYHDLENVTWTLMS